jgi:uncharacterized protein YjbI with pentapeptide repeats
VTRIVGTPLTGIEFNAPGDEAFSSRVNLDSQPRIRIDAGGRITWSSGSDAGDTKLYRTSASALGTEGVFTASLGLITRALDAAPNLAMPDGTILIDKSSDSLYFRSNGAWIAAGTSGSGGVVQYLDDLTDVVTSSLSIGDILKWDGTNWVNDQVPGGYASIGLADLTDVSTASLTAGDFLRWDGSNWVNAAITLGVDTTGDYVTSVTGSTGVTVTGSGGESSSPTISIGQDVATNASVTFGNVTSGSIQVGVVDQNRISTTDNYLVLDSNYGTTIVDDNLTVNGYLTPSHGAGWEGIIWPSNLGGGGGDIAYIKYYVESGENTRLHIHNGDNEDDDIYLDSYTTNVSGSLNVTGPISGSLVGNASTASALQTPRTIAISGDASGSVSFDGSSSVDISVSIQPNSVALGTDTTGNYVNDVVSGTGVTVTHTPGEGSSASIAIGQDVATTASVTFARIDANSASVSGQLTAGNADVVGTLHIGSVEPNDYDGTIYMNNGAFNVVSGSSAGINIQSGGTGWLTLYSGGRISSGNTPLVAFDNASVTASAIATTGDVTVGGNLTVNGTTTTLNTENLVVEDNIIVLNSNVSGSPSLNAGIEVERGDDPNVVLRWNESTDSWEVTSDGSTYKTLALTTSSTGIVALGTDTTGNYMSDVAAGTGVTISHTPGEGSTASISIGQSVGVNDEVTFARVNIGGEGAGGKKLVFEGPTNDNYEITLEAQDATIDRFIYIPDADGTIALVSSSAGAISLGTDTTGDYVASLVQGNGITITNNSGEGSTPTIAVSGSVVTVDSISTPDFIQFDTTYTPTALAPGKMQWDPDYGTLQLGMIGGNVNLQIGQEMLVYVYNDTTEHTTLTDGEMVFITGVQGARPSVRRAGASNTIDSSKPLGMVTESIPWHQYGFICISGAVHGLNTAAYQAGDILWLSQTDGQVTTTKPSPPTDTVFVGVVLRANSGNGAIWVAPQNGYKLDEIHNVSLSSPANGDYLRYNSSSSIWVNDQINLGTDTVGNYMTDVVAGTGVTVTHTPGEGSTASIAIGQNVSTTSSVTFAAVTANLVGNASTASALKTPRTIQLTGDVTGSVSFDGSGNASISTSIANIPNDSVTLGTDTTGSYVASLVQGTGVTITNNSGEGATPTIAIGQAVGTNASVEFAKITMSGPVEGNTTVTTKEYVDNIAAGINYHAAVNLATTAALPNSPTYNNGTNGYLATLTASTSGRLVVDGSNASTGNRILVKDQADARQNGIYDCTEQGSASVAWVLTRSSDGDNTIPGEVDTGDAVFVLGGTNNIRVGFTLTSSGSGTNGLFILGTDNLVWTEFAGISQSTAGAGLIKDGNALSVATANSGRIVVNADDIDLATVAQTNTTGTAGKSFVQSHTVDSYGRITGTVTADVQDASTSTKGIAQFNSSNFSVSSGSVSIANNGIALGTQTTGDYVSSLVAGTGVTLANNSGESATPTISIGQAVATTSSVTFAAVTASLIGNASTASQLATARTISLTGDVTGSVSFSGSANASITTTIAANSVALGTDTTGNYMIDVASGTGVSVSHTPGEGSTATVSIGQDVATTSSVTFAALTTTGSASIGSTASVSSELLVAGGRVRAVYESSQARVQLRPDVSGTPREALRLASDYSTLNLQTSGGIYGINSTGSITSGIQLTNANIAMFSPAVIAGPRLLVSGSYASDFTSPMFADVSTSVNFAVNKTSSSSVALLLNDTSASSTNNIFEVRSSGSATPRVSIGYSGNNYLLSVESSSIASASINSGSISSASVNTASISSASIASASIGGASVSSASIYSASIYSGTASLSSASIATASVYGGSASLSSASISGTGVITTASIASASIYNTLYVGSGGLTVAGNLTINGTTTTVNSTTITVDDPILTLGGDTVPTSDDNKDRGIEFRYYSGAAASLGFMGYDDSANWFTFLTGATNTSEVFSGTAASINVGGIAINGTALAASNLSNGTVGSGSVVLSSNGITGSSGSPVFSASPSIAGALLSTASLSSASLISASLASASLISASLASASLQSASLASASLVSASLVSASLVSASLASASLQSASLNSASLVSASLASASLISASLASASLQSASLNSASLQSASLNSASLVGPTMSGSVTLPATTHFPEQYLSISSSVTLSQATHRYQVMEFTATTGTSVLTIPTNAQDAWPIGSVLTLVRVGAGEVQVTGSTGVTVNNAVGTRLRAQWSTATLRKRATDTWLLSGDLKV